MSHLAILNRGGYESRIEEYYSKKPLTYVLLPELMYFAVHLK